MLIFPHEAFGRATASINVFKSDKTNGLHIGYLAMQIIDITIYMTATIVVDNGKQIWRQIIKPNKESMRKDKKIKVDMWDQDDEIETLEQRD